jgi:hypothetical protein
MTKSIRKLITACLITLILGTQVLIPVKADANVGNVSGLFDDNGNLLPGVTDLGEVEITDASWMNINLGVVDIVPTGHEYVTADGNTVFVPSASTLVAMAANPEESGLSDISGAISGYDTVGGEALAIGSLIGIISGNDGAYDLAQSLADYATASGSLSQLYQNIMNAYSSTDYADALNSGSDFNWTLFNSDMINILWKLIKTSINDKQISTLYLVYSNCSESPTGCPANLCELAPQEASCTAAAAATDAADTVYVTAPSCPVATVTRGTVLLNIIKIAPNYPLVVGQDPNKRGADVYVSASIQPTVYKYYTQVPVYGTSKVCSGDQSKCKIKDMITVTTLIRMDCTPHTIYYKEPIIGVKATASLTKASQDWINNGLSAYYYGAAVKKPIFTLVPGLANATGSCNGSNVCSASATINRIQFQDPGYYGLSLSVTTAGTPVSGGRTLTGTGSLSVAFISVRLTSGN